MTNNGERLHGKVCWFNESLGYGFIKSDKDEQEYFVHWKGIIADGFKKLVKDQLVSFELEEYEERTICIEVELLDG